MTTVSATASTADIPSANPASNHGWSPRAWRIGQIVPIAWAWATWLALLALLVWAMNRSLNLTDEAALLLGYKYPWETVHYTSHFTLIVAKLLGWLHPGILTYRWTRFALTICSVSLFAVGLSRWLRHWFPASGATWTRVRFILPFIAVGDLYGYAIFGPTVSYNTLNADILLVCSGILLTTFRGSPTLPLRRAGAYLFIGGLTGLQFFIKFPTSIAFFVACAILVVLNDAGDRWPRRLLRLALLTCGYALGFVLFFAVFLDFPTWLDNFRTSLATVVAPSPHVFGSHNPSELAARSAANVALLAATVCPQAVMSSALWFIIMRVRRREARAARGVILTSLLTIGMFISLLVFAVEETIPGFLRYQGSILGFSSVLAYALGVYGGTLLAERRRPRIPASGAVQCGAVMALLCAIPVIGALGTNLPFLAAGEAYLGFWSGAIVVALVILSQRVTTQRMLPILYAVPLVLVPVQVARGFVLHPFDHAQISLLQQTTLLARSGDLAGLRVDRETKGFLDTIDGLVVHNSDFRPGDPVIAAYDLPGVVYALGGVSPGFQWFFADPSQQERNCQELRSTRLRTLNRAIVLVHPAMQPSFRSCLRSVGIDFPGRYRLAGATQSFYDGQAVKVYVPLGRKPS